MSSEPHLPDSALEALAHGRSDLVSGDDRAHADRCSQCAARVRETRALSDDVVSAFERATEPVGDVDAMIARALAKSSTVSETRAAPVSARVLSVASVLAAASALAVVWVELAHAPSVGVALDTLQGLVTAAVAVHGAVERVVPGGWSVLGLAGGVVLLVLSLPLRALLRGVPGGAAAAAALLVWLGGADARALEIEGEWPENEEAVTLSVEGEPASVVLRRAAEATGLGLVVTLPEDPEVTVHVRAASLREVVEAVLVDAPVVVRRTDAMLVVRPSPDVGLAAGTGMEGELAAEAPGSPADRDRTGGSRGAASAHAVTRGAPAAPPRVTFGGNVHVRPDEYVEEVVTFFGNALVEGRVAGDAVTFFGNLTLGPGAVIEGETVTFFGNLTLGPAADVEGETVTFGGEVTVEEGGEPPPGGARPAIDRGSSRLGDADLGDADLGDADRDVEEQVDEAQDAAADEDESLDEARERAASRSRGGGAGAWFRELVESMARHALLFLLCLLLLRLAPNRFDVLRGAIAAAPLRTGAVGLLSLIGIPLLCVVLVITIVGIPAALVLGLGAFLGVYVGLAVTAAVLGAVLPFSALAGRPVAQVLAGVAVLFVLSLVPVIGALAAVVATLVGFGALVLTRVGNRPLP